MKPNKIDIDGDLKSDTWTGSDPDDVVVVGGRADDSGSVPPLDRWGTATRVATREPQA